MKPNKILVFLFFSFFLLSMFGCGSDETKMVYIDMGSGADSDNGETDDTDPELDPGEMTGEELYDNYCAACHGSKENTNIIVKTAEEFKKHIDLGTGGMDTDALAALTQEQLESIADYLTDATETDAFAVTTDYYGKVSYNAYCSTCHGSGESTTADPVSVEAITTAIDSGMGGTDISSLDALTDDDLREIADYLNQLIECADGSNFSFE